jgi:hypothetical protein
LAGATLSSVKDFFETLARIPGSGPEVEKLAVHQQLRTDGVDWWAGVGTILNGNFFRDARLRQSFGLLEPSNLTNAFSEVVRHGNGTLKYCTLFVLEFDSAEVTNTGFKATFKKQQISWAGDKTKAPVVNSTTDVKDDQEMQRLLDKNNGFTQRIWVRTLTSAYKRMGFPMNYQSKP